MNLPKRNLTIYHTQLPSNKKRVSFRPFLVKDTKAMLAAQLSEDPIVMFSTVKSIVQGCMETDIDVGKLPIFDFEHLFLKLREVSIGETVPLKFWCQQESCQSNENAFCNVSIDLRNVKTEKLDGHSKIIPLFDDVVAHMKYMTVDDLDELDSVDFDEIESLFHMVASGIECIYDGENKYDAKDFTKEQMNEFLELLSADQFAKLEEFYETIPRPKLTVNYACPVCSKNNQYTLVGLKSFF